MKTQVLKVKRRNYFREYLVCRRMSPKFTAWVGNRTLIQAWRVCDRAQWLRDLLYELTRYQTRQVRNRTDERLRGWCAPLPTCDEIRKAIGEKWLRKLWAERLYLKSGSRWE